jgi:predicted ATP-grasp superfamily ATP-dependent carboligase
VLTGIFLVKMIDIRLTRRVDIDGFTLINGFPNDGLVGPVAISYIVEKLRLDMIGYIESKDFAPLVPVHDNKPVPLIKLYCSVEKRLLVVFAEWGIPTELVYEMGIELYNFARANHIGKIVTIGSFPTEKGGDTAVAIGANDAAVREIKRSGMVQVDRAFVGGINAIMLMHASMDDGNGIGILVPVQSGEQTAQDIAKYDRYAEIAIKAVNKLLGINIDVTDLDRAAQEFDRRQHEAQESHKELGTGPPAYA